MTTRARSYSCRQLFYRRKNVFKVDAWARCYKTFQVTSKLECLSLPSFQPSLTSVGKTRSLPQLGALERWFTQVSFGLIHKHQTKLLRNYKDNYSNLLQKFAKYVRKKFYKLAPGLTHKHQTRLERLRQGQILQLIKKFVKRFIVLGPGAGAYPSEEPIMCSTLGQAPGLTHKHQTRLERLYQGQTHQFIIKICKLRP